MESSDNKNISLKDLIPKFEKIISNDKIIEDFKISIEKLDYELPEVNEIIELAKSNKFHEIALKCKDDNYNFMINFYKENGIIDSIIDKFIENSYYYFTNSDKNHIFIDFLEVVTYFFKDSITTSKSKYVKNSYMRMDMKRNFNKIKINEKIKIYYISLDSNIGNYTQIGFSNSVFPKNVDISGGFYYIHKLSLYDTSTNKLIHRYLQIHLNEGSKHILYPKSSILSPQELDTKIKKLLNSVTPYSPINFNKLNDFNETVKLVCNNLITECRFYENFYITDQYKTEIENLKNENVNLKIENGNLKNKKEQLKKDIENLKYEKEKFKKWNESLKIKYDNLKTEIDQLNEEKHKLRIEIRDYSKSLDPILQRLRSLKHPQNLITKYINDEYLKINKKVEQINDIEKSMNLYFQNQYETLKSAKDRIEKVAAEKINAYIEVLEKSMKEVENEKQINQEKFDKSMKEIEEEKNKFIKIYEEKTSEYQNMIDHFDDYVTTELQKKLAEQIKLFKEFNEKDWDVNIKYKFIEKVLNSATANKSSDLRVSDLEFKDLNEVLKCLQIFNMFELCANENNSKKIKRFTFEFLNKINEFISKIPIHKYIDQK